MHAELVEAIGSGSNTAKISVTGLPAAARICTLAFSMSIGGDSSRMSVRDSQYASGRRSACKASCWPIRTKVGPPRSKIRRRRSARRWLSSRRNSLSIPMPTRNVSPAFNHFIRPNKTRIRLASNWTSFAIGGIDEFCPALLTSGLRRGIDAKTSSRRRGAPDAFTVGVPLLCPAMVTRQLLRQECAQQHATRIALATQPAEEIRGGPARLLDCRPHRENPVLQRVLQRAVTAIFRRSVPLAPPVVEAQLHGARQALRCVRGSPTEPCLGLGHRQLTPDRPQVGPASRSV